MAARGMRQGGGAASASGAARARGGRRASSLKVGGLAVEVSRGRQKNMYVRIKPPDGRVCVSAPSGVSDARIAKFVGERMPWIEEHRARLLERARRREKASVPNTPPTGAELAEWRAVVAAFAPALVEKWAPRLGVAPGRLAYRNMVSRWGSCNVKTGRICLNVQLAAQPPECLEYVVVHELCHLIEANHGPRFKALLDANLPGWRDAERKLRGAIRR